MICAEQDERLLPHHLTAAVERFTAHAPIAGYASYRARLGLTIATLAGGSELSPVSGHLR
jgi:hypothetical protein